jgi:hypothetical protein
VQVAPEPSIRHDVSRVVSLVSRGGVGRRWRI